MDTILIIGLGNPGIRYNNTRHNSGFMCVEACEKNYFCKPTEKKFDILISSTSLYGKKILFGCPQTFMNCCGESIYNLISYYKIPLHQLLIIYDDFALPFGKLRLRNQGSAGGHNGIKSIINYLGNTFPRIKIGIGAPPSEVDCSNYVLGLFSRLELNHLENIYPTIIKLIDIFCQKGFDSTKTFLSTINDPQNGDKLGG